MATLTHYEVAWNMYQAGSSMEQITQVVERHRATIYRWLHRRLTKPAVGVQRYHNTRRWCRLTHLEKSLNMTRSI